ncbi:transketolase [Prauserella muralis]|uniref:Transketolase n=1 Tax=Prauserella muralis TaxID=588067 RepID=A0A2V4AGW1_9PSEU|nr:transketolase [Prauserella muralis]PXY19135.1 transketolase [Prauserella muralis]TWE29044.1 transketolase [Prauserella muralis]
MSEIASTAENNPLLRRNYPADWTDLDTRAVDTIRVLAADAVENCGSGHPGTAMSLAPVAYSLFQRIMRHDPTDPEWPARDRFVLSAGHSSLTLYIQLFLAGYGLEMEDLKQLRKWGSRTPGHPEYRHTPGVETTTGPLGQGLANAVGMAMAARRERGLLDPEAPEGESVFDHHVYVIASDGDIEEGVTSEASSIAGRQELGNLVVIYDDNKISIEDDTNIALSEDTAKRYEAYGWHVQVVDGAEDVVAFEEAVAAAKAETTRPSFILLRTVIGYPAPNKMDTGKAHGAALGADEVAAVKEILGFDPERSFHIDDDVLAHTRGVVDRAKTARAQWQERFDAWAAANPERKELADRLRTRSLPAGWAEKLPAWEPDAKGIATRKASGEVLNAIGDALPELWGGSADLAESNNTIIKNADSFGPAGASTDMFSAQPYGRNLHFGVREHAMGSILNGIALHGGTRPYGATFLIFSDYMRPAVRLAALMKAPVVYVWTHDSIGLGEDGPTHQPIEQLASLRAIPGLNVVRPADANETAAAWKAALEDIHAPTGLALTRQNVPVLEGTSTEGVAKGGYVLAEASNGSPEVVLIATGSEVQLAVEARKTLEAEGVATSVVSMPCVEWFDAQEQSYRDAVIPPTVKARVAVEAGIAQPWHRFVGDGGEVVSIEHFGASADYTTLFTEFGFTAEAVVAAARRTLEKNA